ncbi:PP2C family protein-serine/threonine phosphatase [Paenibacillus sp.]|uniref:PP2C family protein-serine/threonine phosphatase n=1 Tax=Paenibacillus sp. TaxID=58172 RepID=UPI002D52E811|nr:SpoIIE family protein phosphatase [Paenibacillus sp.]HZG58173.1 SpoIIE family protein phosphatase [Paenibacillus sp.]
MDNARRTLLLQLFAVSAAAVAVGTVLLTMSNVFLNHISLRVLLRFNIPAIMAGNFIIVAALLALARRWVDAGSEPKERLFRYMTLPGRLFAWLLALSAALSALYHLAELARGGFSFSSLTPAYVTSLTYSLINEMTTALVIGTLIYALCRRAVRPHLIRLGGESRLPGRRSSVVVPLGVASLSCFFIMASAGVDFIYEQGRSNPNLWDLAVVLAVRFVFCLTIFSLLLYELRDAVRTALSQLRGLLDGGAADRRPIPVVSADELGDLAESFNALQRRMQQASEEMRRELRLAYQVQKRLLPDTRRRLSGFEIAAVSSPCREVGGDVFDIAERGEGGFAVMIGDVSGKGMPASMLVTAALALFRKAIREGATPAQTLGKLNAAFAETLKGRMYVTMGVGFWDPASGVWTYASAGHVAPYVLRGGRTEELEVRGALPLGIDPEAAYRETTTLLRPGDGVLLYTDGIVEAERGEGGMLGFDGLERLLAELPGDQDASEAVRRITEGLPPRSGAASDDDRTLVMLRYVPDAARSRTLTATGKGGAVS